MTLARTTFKALYKQIVSDPFERNRFENILKRERQVKDHLLLLQARLDEIQPDLALILSPLSTYGLLNIGYFDLLEIHQSSEGSYVITFRDEYLNDDMIIELLDKMEEWQSMPQNFYRALFDLDPEYQKSVYDGPLT